MTTAEAPAPRHRRRGGVWINVALALALTAIIVAFLGQPSSGSMSPTLEPGDRLIVNRLAFVGSDPAPGDIVVFRPDESWGEKPVAGNWFTGGLQWVGETTGIRPYVLVKRVIAGEGQAVECCDADGRVLVDGEPLDEPYVVKDLPFVSGELDCDSMPMSTRCFAEVTVPEDAYLVLGDNRANSADSVFLCRGVADPDDGCWRWMQRAAVFGKAGPILWPLSRWGGP
ncbi:signal peptidase I [Microbacterium sp. SA39]|uniref:signal peptidase I n=1 Tax=Microbacterium sp. SA39 TaxID=1263625 RepID=UPI0005FA2C2D|nr:signal peptidase I [Microbacterium sp. SA39]KJQ55075.1 Signal peptidase I [Microbacterium sp. SA39]